MGEKLDGTSLTNDPLLNEALSALTKIEGLISRGDLAGARTQFDRLHQEIVPHLNIHWENDRRNPTREAIENRITKIGWKLNPPQALDPSFGDYGQN